MLTYETVIVDGKEITVAKSSYNLFADFGRPNPNEQYFRARLANCIITGIKRRGLSRRQAAKLLGVSRMHVRWLQYGSIDRFSLENLFQMVAKLGIDITVSCRQHAPGLEGELRFHLPQDLEEQQEEEICRSNGHFAVRSKGHPAARSNGHPVIRNQSPRVRQSVAEIMQRLYV